MADIKENKILMIAATPFFSDRGCHIRIYNEIKYLEKEGVDVTLCTYHLGKDIEGFDIKRSLNVPWYKKVTPGASWHKLYLDVLLLGTSYREYLRIKPKIIHAHLYEGLMIAYIVKLLSLGRTKIVFDCQGSLAEEMYAYTLHKNWFFRKLYPAFVLIERIILAMPDTIICSSENSYNFLVGKYKISKDRISVLNDGIDTELFQQFSPEGKQKLRGEFGVPQGNAAIIYTGSMTAAKGVGDLLEAIPGILENNSALTFIFAGYGDLESIYKEKYQEYVDAKNLIFLGRISYFDLPKYLALADYAIDPKKDSSEASGKVLNYIAAGLRVICFENNFNSSLLRNDAVYIKNLSEVSVLGVSSVASREIDDLDNAKALAGLITIYQDILKRRIGIDCRALSIPGGVKTYGLNLVSEILKQDSKNTYCLFYNSSNLLGTFEQENVREVVVPFDSKFLHIVWDQVVVALLTLFYRVDVIHGLKNTVPLMTFSKRVVTVHDLIPAIYPRTMGFFDALYWRLVFGLISSIECTIVCDSDSTMNDFNRLYKTRNPVIRIYPGINPGLLHSSEKKNQILYVGSLEKRKNIPRLLRAFARVLVDMPSFRLILVGKPGQEDANIDLEIYSLGLDEKVLKKGFVSKKELEQYYRDSSAFAYISEYEGFGFPVLEAMAAGLPVVTSSSSSLAEIAGGAARLIDPLDINSIYQGIREVIQSREFADNLVQKGYARSREFSWLKSGDDMKKIYEHI